MPPPSGYAPVRSSRITKPDLSDELPLHMKIKIPLIQISLKPAVPLSYQQHRGVHRRGA